MAELLTPSIAYAYNEKAKALPYNGMQDIGERRRLRQDLQERCGITELEAINIINGFHIDTYCIKYLRKAREAAEGTPEPTKSFRGYTERQKMSKTKSIVTDYAGICFFCGKPAECEHHLLFGNGIRELAEQDGLKVPACNKCHNMGKQIERIHENIMAEKLSKMLGQAIYESKIGTREEFRKRYGKSYL